MASYLMVSLQRRRAIKQVARIEHRIFAKPFLQIQYRLLATHLAFPVEEWTEDRQFLHVIRSHALRIEKDVPDRQIVPYGPPVRLHQSVCDERAGVRPFRQAYGPRCGRWSDALPLAVADVEVQHFGHLVPAKQFLCKLVRHFPDDQQCAIVIIIFQQDLSHAHRPYGRTVRLDFGYCGRLASPRMVPKNDGINAEGFLQDVQGRMCHAIHVPDTETEQLALNPALDAPEVRNRFVVPECLADRYRRSLPRS